MNTQAFTATLALLLAPAAIANPDNRPNILWITSEDHGPHLGCYGDTYAHTPNLDNFAKKSLRYDIAWSNAPVCAPARTAIITGVYPTSTGGQHMRSEIQLPRHIQLYPQLLREAGYYTTNNSKTDYNVASHGQIWDDSSANAHYKNRADNQPFFAIFNINDSHEGRIRPRTNLPHHDPANAPIPPYHPDTPEIRRDWAEYHYGITKVDAIAGNLLNELHQAGLADNTIVFFYSDHGAGMPRSKRWPYNSGLQVAMIVHIPEKFNHLAPKDYNEGGHTRRPVSFVDLAPTLLSLININPPEWMQGHAFMGHHETKPGEFLYGFRGRMDERYDLVRSVRNDRYIYIRNYMPHLIYGQYLDYMFQTQTTQIWHDLYQTNQLTPPQTFFWEPKPAEELYDLENDPHEIHNLANSPNHQEILAHLRTANRQHIISIHDVGFLPEAEKHRRASDNNTTIYEMARDPNLYPVEEIFNTAELAATRNPDAIPRLLEAMDHPDPAIRYWATIGILIRGHDAFTSTANRIRTSLNNDDNPSVRIAAANILIQFGTEMDSTHAIDTLLNFAPADTNGAFTSLAAMNILADLNKKHLSLIKPIIANINVNDPTLPERANNYVERLINQIMAE